MYLDLINTSIFDRDGRVRLKSLRVAFKAITRGFGRGRRR
jgi:hypothetical protein